MTAPRDADDDRERPTGAPAGATGARIHRWEDIPREQVTPALARRLVTGERMMMAQVYLDEGCVVPKHSHENEQLTWIVEGALRFKLGEDGGREVVLRAGEVLHIPSNLPHEAVALEDTLDVDIFAPPRSDWLDGTDTYFHEARE
ncbi:MAG: cupin domain-containing protein [Gemmatimonadota bacterium]|jgi:quercetin dioxygenase-like cupin family protein